jgi:hypothetical protein
MESMKEKIDLLMGGENEANKLIDCIVPSLTTIESKVRSSVPDSEPKFFDFRILI